MTKPVNDVAGNGRILLEELSAILDRRVRVATKGKETASTKKFCEETVTSDEKVACYRKEAHTLGDLSALCLSGGGIRSASFALGVLQGLAARGILSKFDYLSTVSGGGYTGAMLTAWVHRAGYERVEDELVNGASTEANVSPIQHLRRYSSYLSPATGMLSTDALTLFALYLRNLLLNWFVLIPIILLLIVALKLASQWAWSYEASSGTIAVFGLLAIACAGASIVDSLQQRPGWGDESSSSSRFISFELIPMLFAGCLISVAAMKIFQQSAETATTTTLLEPPGFALERLQGLGSVGGVTVIAACIYFIAAILALSFSPPRKQNSTTLNIRTAAFWVGPLVLGALTLSGAVVGYLVAKMTMSVGAVTQVGGWSMFLMICLGPPIFILAVFLAELLYCALTGNVRWGDAEREWLGRAAGYHARAAVVWSSCIAVVYLGSHVVNDLYANGRWPELSGLALGGGASGLLTSILGKSPSTSAVFRKGYSTLKNRSLNFVLGVSAALFVIILTSLLSAVVDSVVLDEPKAIWFDEADRHRTIDPLLVFLKYTAIVAVISSFLVNTNRFSLHGIYRNRLIRAFLGASKQRRTPNAFTDFDANDNLKISELWPNTKDSGKIPPQYLVQNMAMNIIATRELAWQERKALSFVATPYWCGCGEQELKTGQVRPDLRDAHGCYRKSNEYAGPISLGTAMTISGAAASPNMGYHSSPALSVLLTFFNVRLGAWLGNPSPAGNRTYTYRGPVLAGWPMLQEALGLTDGTKSYVYLSDGGHFDNLGLYEMIRRRCHFIVVSDAGSDPDFGFEDLGNAVRKISIDLNVDIEFRSLKMVARTSPPSEGPYFAIADIKYRDKDAKPGILLYIKPNYQGREPISVRSYALKAKVFPHESTVDQAFGESQFEAYRALGRFAVDNIDGSSGKPYADVQTFINTLAAASPPSGQASASIGSDHIASPVVLAKQAVSS